MAHIEHPYSPSAEHVLKNVRAVREAASLPDATRFMQLMFKAGNWVQQHLGVIEGSRGVRA